MAINIQNIDGSGGENMRSRGLIFCRPIKYIFITLPLLLLLLFVSGKKKSSAIFMDALIIQCDMVRHFEIGFHEI